MNLEGNTAVNSTVSLFTKIPRNATSTLIVRDRASSGGGIYNYYQALTRHIRVSHRFVDVGRPHGFYGSEGGSWLAHVPTPVRMVLDWVNLLVRMIGWPGLVLLNPSLDTVELRSLRRDAVNVCLAKLFRRPVIVFWRGWDNIACGTPEFPGGNAGWKSRVYRWADAHIVLASAFRDDLRRWGFKSPIYIETTVVADSILENCVKSKVERKEEVFRLLFLSRVEMAKGVLELLDALALLNQRQPGHYHLTIAGDGPDLEFLKRRASDLALPNIEFAGFVEGMHRSACYADADVFCFLSYTEGMPNAVLEAMAAGLPLISSDAGGLKDILEEGVTGYIVAQDRSKAIGARFSPEDVAARIERLSASEEACRKIGGHNRQYAHERFSAAKVASRLEAICGDILGIES
jgi:glycosyltransferase involved in cell wall biosynthesis